MEDDTIPAPEEESVSLDENLALLGLTRAHLLKGLRRVGKQADAVTLLSNAQRYGGALTDTRLMEAEVEYADEGPEMGKGELELDFETARLEILDRVARIRGAGKD